MDVADGAYVVSKRCRRFVNSAVTCQWGHRLVTAFRLRRDKASAKVFSAEGSHSGTSVRSWAAARSSSCWRRSINSGAPFEEVFKRACSTNLLSVKTTSL
jgi:hypothetical protein